MFSVTAVAFSLLLRLQVVFFGGALSFSCLSRHRLAAGLMVDVVLRCAFHLAAADMSCHPAHLPIALSELPIGLYFSRLFIFLVFSMAVLVD